MNFSAHDSNAKKTPVALRVFTGGVNAISGKADLHLNNEGEQSPPGKQTSQDHVCIPGQPWLDGFKISEEEVR